MATVSELTSKNIANAQANVQTWGDIVVNVKVYGAKGDGVTDDTVAIQSAILSGYNSFIIPNGVYLINGGLISFPARSKVVGVGTAVFKRNTGSTGILINVGEKAIIENITIDGGIDRMTGDKNSFGFNMQPNSTALNCYVDKNIGHGFRLMNYAETINCIATNCGDNNGANGTADGFYNTDAIGTKYVNCESSNNARMGFTITTNSAEIASGEILNCRGSGNSYNQIDIEGYGTTTARAKAIIKNTHMTGSFSFTKSEVDFENCSFGALYSDSCDKFTVKDLVINGVTTGLACQIATCKKVNINGLKINSPNYVGSSWLFQVVCTEDGICKGLHVDVNYTRGAIFNGPGWKDISGYLFSASVADVRIQDRLSKYPNSHPFVLESGLFYGFYEGAFADRWGGTFIVGDRLYDKIPVAGGKIGTVCVTAGTPGTWKSFGVIDI